MVIFKNVDMKSFELSCEAIGTDWYKETNLHKDENTIDVVLADNAKIVSSFETVIVMCDGLETSFDQLDFQEVVIT